MKIKAHAKINLGLDVVRRRGDGYHDLDMIMVPLTLCDVIDINLDNHDSLICQEHDLANDKTNTVMKAIYLMREVYNLKEHFSVHLDKNIPMEAGLAGGSADAAAVMKAINEMLSLHIPLKELAALSKQIGADVPFCILEECAAVKGIGEKVEAFQPNCDFHILLVKPAQGVPTAEAFKMLKDVEYEHPDILAIKEAYLHNDFEALCNNLGNSLETSAFKIVEELQSMKDELIALGMSGVLMTGSGSTIFALTQDEQVLQTAMREMKKKYPFVVETSVYQK